MALAADRRGWRGGVAGAAFLRGRSEVGAHFDWRRKARVVPANANPLKMFPGASVIEIVVDDQSGTYRAVYTVQFREAIFVLHCFQKKAKRGIQTPQEEIERIQRRLRQAVEEHAKLFGEEQQP